MYEQGTNCFYKGEPVTVIANDDGYIAIRRKNGAEIEPALLKDLSMNAPVQTPARKFEISEKQAKKMFDFIQRNQGEMVDRATLEYKLASEAAANGGRPMSWGALPYVIRAQFIAVANGLTLERLFKEYG